jgi:hypothetical protein
LAHEIAARVFTRNNGSLTRPLARKFAELLAAGSDSNGIKRLALDVLERFRPGGGGSQGRMFHGVFVDHVQSEGSPTTGQSVSHDLTILHDPTLPGVVPDGAPTPELEAQITHVQPLLSVPRTSVVIIAGRRPQPESAGALGYRRLNERHHTLSVRTYDWLLDFALRS